MKLVHPDISLQIDFEKNNCYVLSVENASEFDRLTRDLYGQCNGTDEGLFVLSDDDILDMQKFCMFVYDYFGDMLNNKKTLALVNDRVLKILKSNDFVEQFAELNMILSKINQGVLDNMDFDLVNNEEFGYENYIKSAGYRLQSDNKLEENIVTMVDLYLKCSKCRVFVFVNLSTYLCQSKLDALLKQLRYMQANVLLIEGSISFRSNEAIYITIDNDLCVF